MTTIKIADAEEMHLPGITDIYAHAVENGTATYELEPPTLADMTQRFLMLRANGYPYLVATLDEIVIGYAYGGPFRAREAYRFMVEDSIYLSPAAQGKGLGKMLLKTLIDTCTAAGYRQLLAVIGDATPQSASVRLHTRMGFRNIGIVQGSGYKHGRWLDTGFMQLELNEGNRAAPNEDSVPERYYRENLAKRVVPS
ncbi:GNAT family N-acetyltransferase [Limoniibacter endophyticus]